MNFAKKVKVHLTLSILLFVENPNVLKFNFHLTLSFSTKLLDPSRVNLFLLRAAVNKEI